MSATRNRRGSPRHSGTPPPLSLLWRAPLFQGGVRLPKSSRPPSIFPPICEQVMVPAASPVILLFAEINRRRNEHQGTFVATGQFLLGYLTAWTGFSVLATLV